MIVLKFLQQNAEWMCTIAIVGFTAVQCWLAYQQNMQNIKMKRLELASRLDEVAAQFLGDKEEAKIVRTWLVSNASNFGALLNNKDINSYKKLSVFIYNYLNVNIINPEEHIKALQEFTNLVSELDAVLINAKYGFVKAGKEFESTNKEK
ncbi:MAG: hypothetical protein NC200_07255 [Candidatus Gastranaerophilales bacterium]|nr:hypothetical protein [Candidatus Gastranaerophilales bacterium]